MALVQSSLPSFRAQSYDVSVELYREVFCVDSDLRNLFSLEFLTSKTVSNSRNGCPFSGSDTLALPLSMQARILAQSIVDMAARLDNLGPLQRSIDRICNKHVSRDIRPEHYDVVAAAFASAMRTVLEDTLSDEEYAAWNTAIGELAAIFIAREKVIRETAAAREGGWVGFREFLVDEHVHIDSSSAKFVLVPKDKKPVCTAGKGQFSCVLMNIDTYGTIYYNTVLHSPASREVHSVTELESESSLAIPKRAGACLGMLHRNSSGLGGLKTDSSSSRQAPADPDYGAVIRTAADRLPPVNTDSRIVEVMIAPGRLLAQHVKQGAVLELSVPLGGGLAVDMNEDANQEAAGGTSLLRNVLGIRTCVRGRASPLQRHAALTNKSPLAASSVGQRRGSPLQATPPLSPTNVIDGTLKEPLDAKSKSSVDVVVSKVWSMQFDS